ncbi:MAG: ABC transporter substrate-binding protein [Acidimicrobiales bacterium]
MRIHRLKLQAAAVVAACALLAAACGSSKTSTGASPAGSAQVPKTVASAKGPFSWKRYSGQSITVLAETQPWTSAIQPMTSAFEQLTGIHVNWEVYTEEQRRQLAIIQLQSHRPSFDVFMNLKSFSASQYSQAGWYEDLYPFVHSSALTSSSYNMSDFLKAPITSQIIGGKLDGVPTNVEGPVLFYRTDIFRTYGLTPPTSLSAVDTDAKLIEQRSNHSIVGITGRGLPLAVAYTFGTYLHNDGGHWSKLDSAAGVKALTQYADTLKNYGPTGVVNYNFLQSSTLFAQGKVAMEFDSSNELSDILSHATGTVKNNFAVEEFPPGPAGDHPTVLSWSLAMSPFSSHKGPAWLFMQWASSPKIQTQLALQGIASPRSSTASNSAYKATLTGPRVSWANALEKTLAQGNPNVGPAISQQTEARQDIGLMVDKVILGQATPEQAATTATAQLAALSG